VCVCVCVQRVSQMSSDVGQGSAYILTTNVTATVTAMIAAMNITAVS